MELDVAASPFYTPFQINSVNIISASTNTGKTTFLLQIIRQRKVCFFRPINTVIVVLCNSAVDGSVYKTLNDDELTVQVFYLDEFDINDDLTENVLLIFEDVQSVNKTITDCINVHAHHIDLASVFIVCQSILSNDDFKTLLSLSHNVIIFFSGSAGTKLAQFIRQFFFVNSDLKEYLKTIIAYSERHKNIVILELNQVARKEKNHFFAISGLEHFINGDLDNTLVYPHLHKADMYNYEYDDNEVSLDNMDPATLPRGAYVLVKSENVTKKSRRLEKAEQDLTDGERNWNEINQVISNDIESSVKYLKILAAKNLVKSIMGSRFFSIGHGGKTIFLTSQPSTERPLLDYLNAAIRPSAPNETPEPVYVLFTKYLLLSHTPTSFIKNRSLLMAAGKNKKTKKKTSIKGVAKATEATTKTPTKAKPILF